jgi:hypothetical protein
VLAGDPAEFADLDTAELAGPQQGVHLVSAYVKDLCYLFDSVSFRGRVRDRRDDHDL